MVYYRITNTDGKQWLLPAVNMSVGMMLYQPSAWRGRLLKRLFPKLSWCSFIKKILNVEEVECPVSLVLDQKLQKVFGKSNLEYSVFGGTPSAHQKQTIQVYCGKSILGYCKISDNPEVGDLFRHELDYLQWLNACGMNGVPHCLCCEKIDSGEWIFVQSTTKSLRSSQVHSLSPNQFLFLEQLASKTASNCQFEESDLYWALSRAKECVDNFLSEDQFAILQGYDLVCQYYQYLDEPTFAAYHSDFTPWNMFIDKGNLFVFDWEYAKQTFMPYLDLIHFLFQSSVFERHADADSIFRCLTDEYGEVLSRYFDNPKVAVVAYLLDMIGMYAERDKGNATDDTRRLMNLRLELLRLVLK